MPASGANSSEESARKLWLADRCQTGAADYGADARFGGAAMKYRFRQPGDKLLDSGWLLA